jgi:hypothetical protein
MRTAEIHAMVKDIYMEAQDDKVIDLSFKLASVSTNNTTQTLFRKRYVSSYKVLIASMLKKIIQQSSDCNVCDENLCMFFSLFFIHVHGSE